jgi:hypothetical protein
MKYPGRHERMSEPEHRPEVAIAIVQPLWIEAKSVEEGEAVNGYAIAVGWDRPQSTTYYLVSDPNSARPVWISEDDVTSNSVRPPD